jgi:hypothetical protein
MPMMATTIISSMRVKPFWIFFMYELLRIKTKTVGALGAKRRQLRKREQAVCHS